MTDERKGIRRSEDNDVAQRITQLETNQQKILDVMLGPEDTWGVRQTEQGTVYKVERIDNTLRNGGVRIRLPAGAWAAIVIAIIAGIFQVAAALAGS